MSLTHENIKTIAHLARINIAKSHYDDYVKQLNKIMEFVDQLQTVDTKEVVPMAHPLEMKQRLRNDEVTEVNHRDTYQKIAPKTDVGLYLVPKVIE